MSNVRTRGSEPILRRAPYTYAVDGFVGRWVYVGQAWWIDDNGVRVEHDHVRVVKVGTDPAREEWVPPSDLYDERSGRSSAAEVAETA